MDSKIHSTLNYLLNQRQPMLQFHLLKYLSYDNLVKLLLVCKDGGPLCDANKSQNNPGKLLRYLMLVIAL